MSRPQRLLVAGVLLCLSTPAWVTPAHALPTPVSPSDPSVAEQWVNPAARSEPDDGINLDLREAPDLGASQLQPGQPLTVTLTVSNSADSTARDLTLRPQRGYPTPTAGQARQALSLEDSAYPLRGASISISDVEPGERRDVTITVSADDLSLEPGAVYPVMFSLSGTLDDGGEQSLSSERMLVSVAAEATEGETTPPQAPGLNLVYPLTAEIDIVPGELGTAPEQPALILSSEQLAGQLAEGGRLDRLLSTYRYAITDGPQARNLREGSCLAIDPALVDTVARMATDGYVVAGTRPSPVQKSQRLRDSWGSSNEADQGEKGTGAEHAQQWLDRLREVASRSCTVALPWNNADLNAVAATRDEWLFRESVERGPTVLQEELGATPVNNLVIPNSGYVTEQAAPALGWADHSTSTVSTGGMQQKWEKEVAALAPQEPTTDDDTALESTDLTPAIPAVPPAPAQSVSVLVADNTTWGVPSTDSSALLAPGITAWKFPGALGAMLASTGPAPATTGYSNPEARFDYLEDSTAARAISAGTALRLTVAEKSLPGNWAQKPDPIFAVPPANLDPDTAATLLDTTAALFADSRALPLALGTAVTTPTGLESQPIAPPTPGVVRFGSPYVDPSVISDAEVLRAGQQARYIDDLTRITLNDPAIALTRYGFTLPLRLDVVSSLTATDRNSISTYDTAVLRTDERLDANRQALQDLRGSVALIPPGNVYTRVSESSPLLIVAENGLPLPVDAELAYSGPTGAHVNVPERVHIPAHGSITVQMTADLPSGPSGRDQTQLQLWLATRDGSPISTPVEITVQTRAGIVGTYGIALLLVIGLTLTLVFRVGRRRSYQRRQSEHIKNG
ncbi:hypothetical protein CATRI_13085 [Corynebacterium atrinae]|uniref:hypothetical protein n=1 Tax=Corynebacterium atrinae TaxID=1336740 RepID=UPI0025B44897|nr:hypothetical protein [Corynebacterium atrinae]WJY64662.1 hypothetical protein CATRI_13085 [Corynebacterium atrinae]